MNEEIQKLLVEIFRLKLNNSCLKDFFEVHGLDNLVSEELLHLPMNNIVYKNSVLRLKNEDYLETSFNDVIKLTFHPEKLYCELYYSSFGANKYECFIIYYKTLTKDFT